MSTKMDWIAGSLETIIHCMLLQSPPQVDMKVVSSDVENTFWSSIDKL